MDTTGCLHAGCLRGEAEASLVEILDPFLHWSVVESWSEYSCVVFHFGTLLEVISVLHTAVSLGTMLQVGSGVPEVASFAWYSILQKAPYVNCTGDSNALCYPIAKGPETCYTMNNETRWIQSVRRHREHL